MAKRTEITNSLRILFELALTILINEDRIKTNILYMTSLHIRISNPCLPKHNIFILQILIYTRIRYRQVILR